jgi:TatA/E family protein of Tat protein translocase
MGLDSPEKLAIVFLIALIAFGRSRLPELGRSLGQGIRGCTDSMDGGDEPGDHAPRQPGIAAPGHGVSAQPLEPLARQLPSSRAVHGMHVPLLSLA